MKKSIVILSILLIAVSIITESKAQASWELGARFGDRGSVEATIPLGMKPRLQPAVYFYGSNNAINDFGIAGYFDWMFKLSD